MANRRLKRPRDPIQLGKLIVDIATGQVKDGQDDGKNPNAVELGRRGGLKGGKARSERLSEEERRDAARYAARVRAGAYFGRMRRAVFKLTHYPASIESRMRARSWSARVGMKTTSRPPP